MVEFFWVLSLGWFLFNLVELIEYGLKHITARTATKLDDQVVPLIVSNVTLNRGAAERAPRAAEARYAELLGQKIVNGWSNQNGTVFETGRVHFAATITALTTITTIFASKGLALGDIEHVLTLPVAHAQCRDWLVANVPQADFVATNSTVVDSPGSRLTITFLVGTAKPFRVRTGSHASRDEANAARDLLLDDLPHRPEIR